MERTPEAVALVYEGQQLTYRELNRRANRLARHLQSVLFQAPTVEKLAAVLEGGGEEGHQIVVPIRAEGSRPPLFCLHPAGGQVLAYERLVAHLSADQPVYGIQSRALLDSTREHGSVEDMAEQYAAAICRQQLRGPYCLLGWSMGGVLAVSIARRLEERGAEVAFIGLLDAHPRFMPAGPSDPLASLAMVFGGALNQAWGGEQRWPVCRRVEAALPFLQQLDFELLFSIVNPYVLKEEVLSLASRMSINYHDSLLPKFSGSHAVPWALIDGEPKTGVSWHVMGSRADAGAILAQAEVPIATGETARSLNGKCGIAALATFGGLLRQLRSDELRPIPQDASGRSFRYRWRRPTPGCFIDFDQPATAVERFARGLTYGNRFNPIGFPKVLLGDLVFWVDEARLLEGTRSGEAPGALLSRPGEGAVRAATRTEDVELRLRAPERRQGIARFTG